VELGSPSPTSHKINFKKLNFLNIYIYIYVSRNQLRVGEEKVPCAVMSFESMAKRVVVARVPNHPLKILTLPM
jgi:hypothetical protein